MARAAACLLLLAATAFADDAALLEEKAAAIKAKLTATAGEESSAAPPLAGDANGDGVLSKKEARQLRRAERRARRRAQGLPDEPEDADEDAAAAEEASQRSSAASAKAASAASAMKSMMTPEAAGGGMPGGMAGAASSPRPGGTKDGPSAAAPSGVGAPSTTAAGARAPASSPHYAGATSDPANPAAPADFVLAARGGYAPAFAKAGLKLSADGRSVVRADGSPATAADYARLGAEIRAMPAAVGRRADFFSAVSPARYAEVKRGLKEKPELSQTSLKDAGLTSDERDIVHTRSCSKVEGGCNESVEKGAYKKGDFIAPEDLDRMWEAMEKELGGGESGEAGRAPSLDPGLTRAARESALAAAEGLAGDSPQEANAEHARGTAATASPGVAGAAAAAGNAAKRLLSTLGLAEPVSGGGPAGSVPAAALAAAAAAVLAAAVFLLRRRGPSPED